MLLKFSEKSVNAKFRSIVQSRLTWILLLIVAGGIASNLSAVDELPQGAGRPLKPAAKEALMREGVRLESKRASCRIAGDRLAVEFDGTRTLDALPNLAAQRVFQACRDDSADSEWIVSGKITEFQNSNYLLLENVVRAPTR